MYTSYYGMNSNPFLKETDTKYAYQSEDYKQILSRLEFLKEIKGIGLFTGTPGLGKTFIIRSFIDKLNKDLYKVIYISATKNSVYDFFKMIASSLDIDAGVCYKTELYKKIQSEIIRLVKIERIQPIIIIDDAQNLSRDILTEMKVLFDFEMDSKDYTMIALVGYPELKEELQKNIYNSLTQRILVNYSMTGLSREETKEYLTTRLTLAGVNNEIFTEDALNSLYSCSKSSPRRLNTLVLNSLLLGSQKKSLKIDSSIVMLGKEEMDLKWNTIMFMIFSI